MRQILHNLTKNDLRGLILDLRFNPGGLLMAAIETCDLFVAEGRIVSTEGRNTKPRVWEAHREGTFEGFPMAVLVNRYSASASEILAACLQDHARAIVVGERTWGKGSVQNVIELDEGKSALKLTTAGYIRPSGKNIHRFPDSKESDPWGVYPDEGYKIQLTDVEMSELMQNRYLRDLILTRRTPPPRRHGAPPEPDDEGRGPVEPVRDRQLEKALDYLSKEFAKATRP